jgi:uncharacterized membrane protein
MRDETVSMRRLVVAGASGALVAVIAGLVTSWQFTVVGAWGAASAAFLIVAWAAIVRCDGAATERLSTVEDDGRVTAGLILLGASTASLIGVGFARTGQRRRRCRAGGAPCSLLTIVLSWIVVNTVFTPPRTYHAPIGGIDFPGTDDHPDYRDFAYLAFTVGMTYQVSDTGLRTPKYRRTLLGHALLSYLFGTGIVATTINVVAGFVR